MKIISAKKDNITYYGSMAKIADKIGVTPTTVERWNKEKKYIVFKNGFEINLNTEKL